jgi:hypothetical protein
MDRDVAAPVNVDEVYDRTERLMRGVNGTLAVKKIPAVRKVTIGETLPALALTFRSTIPSYPSTSTPIRVQQRGQQFPSCGLCVLTYFSISGSWCAWSRCRIYGNLCVLVLSSLLVVTYSLHFGQSVFD